MTGAAYLRYMGREARGSRGRLAFFVLCLAVGVGAVVAVAGLSDGLDRGIRAQAKNLLAADLVVQGRLTLPADAARLIASLPGARVTTVKELVTVVSLPQSRSPAGQETQSESPAGQETPSERTFDSPVHQLRDHLPLPNPPGGGEHTQHDAIRSQPSKGADLARVQAAIGSEEAPRPGKSLLVELKAVQGEFPFYGTLTLDPAHSLASLLAPDAAVVAPELLARFGIRRGDHIKIGFAQFRIAGVVLSEPSRLTSGFAIGPRVFLSEDGLARTQLEGFGGRIEYRTLVALDERAAPIEQVAARIKKALSKTEWYEVQTYTEAQPALRDGLKQAWRFLGLGALLSLLIGGIGVSQTVRAWLAGRMEAIAVLKCLGMRPREILLLYLGQTALLGLAGSAGGVLLGILVERLVPRLMGGFVQAFATSAWHPWALVRGLALGVGVAVFFSLPPLASILSVAPARVFRRDAEPLPGHLLAQTVSALALLGGIFVTAVIQSRSAAWGAAFTAGLLAAGGVLSLGALVVVLLVRRLPRGFARVSLRHGLSALARPGAGTSPAIVALGLGVLVVLTMYLVQTHLTSRLRADLPTAAPTAFLVDIQPAQWPRVKVLLERTGASRIDSVPIVVARISGIDGKNVRDLAGERPEDRGRKWALTREQRLTYLEKLPPTNTIVAGSLWNDPARAEVSLEKDFAKDLGAHLGSTLSFDLQGVPLNLVVTSLRTVEWESFGINFFIIVEPGVLESAPQQRVAAARLPAGREQDTQDLLAASFPNVVMIKIRQVLETIVTILERIGFGIRILGGFTVLAGITILAGAIGAGAIRRGREVALLKTLGMTRGGILAAYSAEYALVGLVAGAIGSVSGGVLAWTVLTRGMQIPWRFDAPAFVVAIAGTVLLSVLAGIAASLRALARRPAEVLRGER